MQLLSQQVKMLLQTKPIFGIQIWCQTSNSSSISLLPISSTRFQYMFHCTIILFEIPLSSPDSSPALLTYNYCYYIVIQLSSSKGFCFQLFAATCTWNSRFNTITLIILSNSLPLATQTSLTSKEKDHTKKHKQQWYSNS